MGSRVRPRSLGALRDGRDPCLAARTEALRASPGAGVAGDVKKCKRGALDRGRSGGKVSGRGNGWKGEKKGKRKARGKGAKER